MNVTAYILIQTEVGKAADVATQVRAVPGVAEADDVTGPYDVIAQGRSRLDRRPGPPGGEQGADDRRHHPHAHLPGGAHLSYGVATSMARMARPMRNRPPKPYSR